MRKASTYGATLSGERDDTVVAEEVYEKMDDWESSKLVCVVGVDKDDDEGESMLKKWGIRFKSSVRSPPISLTKEVIKSLRSTRVGGEEGDIKAIAEVDGPADSAFIERLRGGMEFISREYTRVCVSEGVIQTGWGGYTLKKALALRATAGGRGYERGVGRLEKRFGLLIFVTLMSRTQYRRGPYGQSTSFPTWPQPVP